MQNRYQRKVDMKRLIIISLLFILVFVVPVIAYDRATAFPVINTTTQKTLAPITGLDDIKIEYVKPISSHGEVQETVRISSLPSDEPSSAVISTANGDKTVQVPPNGKMIVSVDGMNVMHISFTSEPALQIYYGYQINKRQPFKYFYKVDSITTNPPKVTRVIFDTKIITQDHVSTDKITAIMNGNEI